MNKHESIKIAYIGGGSRNWAPTIFGDLALCPELSGEIRLYDIDHPSALANVNLATDLFARPEAVTRFTVSAHELLKDCLSGADFVFLSILPGPMQMFANDLDIPLKYGVIQTVGDTVGPGGLSRNLRAIPVYREFAHAIAAYCPKAWAINYTNPMTLLTQTMYDAEPGIKAIGCCHEVFGTRAWIAGMVASKLGIPSIHRNEIDIDLAGVNHFTFFTEAKYQGEDIFPIVREFMNRPGYFSDKTEASLAREEQGRFGSCDGLIQLEFLRRFGIIGAAGDRHLVEFVPWWCDSVERLRRWGVSITSSAQRLGSWKAPIGDREAELKNYTSAQSKSNSSEVVMPNPVTKALKRSKEEAVDLVLGLCGIRNIDTNVNLPNRGQIENLAHGHVVETMGQVRRDKVTAIVARPLPTAVHTLVEKVQRVQALTHEAAKQKSFSMALEAWLLDPLCKQEPDVAEKMLRELLIANKSGLSGWSLE